MKIEYKLFVILAAFFTPVGLAYGIFTEWKEPVGPAKDAPDAPTLDIDAGKVK